MKDRYELAVVGAGPAGLAAATLAAEAGLATVLFDEQPAPGGQIFRGITTTPVRRREILGADYWRGERLVEAFRAGGAEYRPGATVWSLSREREIGVSSEGVARMVSAERVVIATGALERPFPIPGWTLPGVMTAGAAQILLKTSGLVPQGSTIMAGSGPLLWLLAWQHLNAGARIECILDTTPPRNFLRAAPSALPFLVSPYLGKGLRLLREVRRHIPVITGVVDLRAEGAGRLDTVAWRTAAGKKERRAAVLLLLHQGVVPNVNLAMSAGVEHRWDEAQLCWSPVLDDAFGTSVPGIAVAGDGAGIGGAKAAEERGRIAAIAAVRALRGANRLAAEEADARHALHRHRLGRRFLDLLYRPAETFRRPDGETIVCRCEEVTAREVREAARLGCTGPNQLKAFLRCGMGPCQGRLCGLTVTELIAAERGAAPAEVGHYRLRPPVKPITLGELAGLPRGDEAVKAVVRG